MPQHQAEIPLMTLSEFPEPPLFRIWKKKRSATARITMHPDVWTQGDQEVTRFLSSAVLEAVEVLSAKVKKSGLHIEEAVFLDDLKNKALRSFLEAESG